MREFPESLKKLEEKRIEAPEAVAAELRQLFGYLPEKELPVAIGIYASCLRQTDKADQSRLAIEIGLQLARKVKNIWAEANLLQRRSYVESEAGEIDTAINSSRQALALFLEVDDLDRVGTTLFEQGMNYYHLAEWHRAIRLSMAALHYLDKSNLQYVFACQTCLAMAYADAEEPEKCLVSLNTAKSIAKKIAMPTVMARVQWTEAALLARIGRHDLAAEFLRSVAAEYLSSGQGLEAALATVDLARALLAQNRFREAAQAARSSRSCLIHLPEDSRAAIILESVWRKAELAKISEDFLAQASEELKSCGAGRAPQTHKG